MKQAAYNNGMETGVKNDLSTNINSKNSQISSDEEEKEVQQIIDVALAEMNNGNYEKAITLLETAKQLYASSRAEELQELMIKLQANAFDCNEQKANKSNVPNVHKRNNTKCESKNNRNENDSNSDYTIDQLNMVKNISNCKNYYEVLSISRTATESEIKKAYKKLALHLHPDKNHAPGAAEAFKTLGNAMTILTDAKKRKEYDLSGANYITPSCNLSNLYKPSSSHQQFYSHRYEHHYSFSEASFSGGEEFTAEELFHMFFGNYPTSQGYYRRRPYQSANQRQPQEQGQQPSLAFGLLLVMILMSMFMSLFSTDPLYSLSHSR